MRHTPPPWKISFHGGSLNLFRLDTETTANDAVAEAEGNRRLVEAAPDLLEACRLVIAENEWKCSCAGDVGILLCPRCLCKEAVARAEGR